MRTAPAARAPFTHRLRALTPVLITPQDATVAMRKLSCHAVGVSPDRVTLEPVEERDLLAIPAAVPRVFMTFTYEGAMMAVKGSLINLRADGTEEQHGDLAFRADRQARFRADAGMGVPICAPVSLRVASYEMLTQSVHLSVEGMTVEQGPPLGAIIALSLMLPGHAEPVEVEGQVTKLTAQGTYVRFRGLQQWDHTRIERVVIDGNRETLRHHKQWRALGGR